AVRGPLLRPASSVPRKPEVDLEMVREIMLQAFEKVKPQDPAVVRELVGGVRSINLPRRRTSDERRAPRLDCNYKVRCFAGVGGFVATVNEVSLTGVRMEMPDRLEKDALVEVHAFVTTGRLEPVRCIVRWCRNDGPQYTAGMAFHEPPAKLSRSWVAVLLHSLGFDEAHSKQRRRNTRVSISEPVAVLGPRGEQLNGTALDVGIGGLLLEIPARFGPAETIVMTLSWDPTWANFKVRGKVVSMQRGKIPRYGVQFRDMSPAGVNRLGDYIVKRLSAGAPMKD
ncbi:MAG: PilZ domain-containing protein, partial [Candidatus Eremiobacterota bacterium]